MVPTKVPPTLNQENDLGLARARPGDGDGRDVGGTVERQQFDLIDGVPTAFRLMDLMDGVPSAFRLTGVPAALVPRVQLGHHVPARRLRAQAHGYLLFIYML